MPRSLPALVAGILQSDKTWQLRSAAARFSQESLAPAYQVDSSLPPQGQWQRAAWSMIELTQKLDRLKDAYPNWSPFEPGPYFDLYPRHAAGFCWLEETRYTLRLRLYCDLLLPAFRAAERYWVEAFLPAYHAGYSGNGAFRAQRGDAFLDHLVEEAMPRQAALLESARQAVQGVLDLIIDSGHLDVLTYLGAVEERMQHRPPPGTTLAPGLPPALQRMPREMPTLTLDFIYPRPEQYSPLYKQGQPG